MAHAITRPQVFEMHQRRQARGGLWHTVVSSANRTDANLEGPSDIPPALAVSSASRHLGAVEDHRRPPDRGAALCTNSTGAIGPSLHPLNYPHPFLLGNRAEDGYDGIAPQAAGVEIRLSEAAEPYTVGTEQCEVLERGQRALACEPVEGPEDYHIHLAAGGGGEQRL
jgi:hypothetical protein